MSSLIRKLATILVTLAAAWGTWAAPAGAITGNSHLDFEHTYVGLIIFYDQDGGVAARCTGSLLNEWTVLTGGHCAEPTAVSARIWVTQDFGTHYDPALGYDPMTGYPEFCADAVATRCATSHEIYNYGYFDPTTKAPDIRDTAMIILDQPIANDRYVQVARPGSLDRMATRRGLQNVMFTLTGYGFQQYKPYIIFDRERYETTAHLININSAINAGYILQISSAPAPNEGATCYGDSGGPILYEHTDIVVATDSGAPNTLCMGTSFEYRVDQQAVLDWMHAHAKGAFAVVSLPN